MTDINQLKHEVITAKRALLDSTRSASGPSDLKSPAQAVASKAFVKVQRTIMDHPAWAVGAIAVAGGLLGRSRSVRRVLWRGGELASKIALSRVIAKKL